MINSNIKILPACYCVIAQIDLWVKIWYDGFIEYFPMFFFSFGYILIIYYFVDIKIITLERATPLRVTDGNLRGQYLTGCVFYGLHWMGSAGFGRKRKVDIVQWLLGVKCVLDYYILITFTWSVSVTTARPSEALNLTVLTKAQGQMVV